MHIVTRKRTVIIRDLAYALRNIYGSKTSFSSDIFSLGYMFKRLYLSSSILQMSTFKMLVRDLKKRGE